MSAFPKSPLVGKLSFYNPPIWFMSMFFDLCKDIVVKIKLFLSWQIKNTHWQINLVAFTEYPIYWVGVGRVQLSTPRRSSLVFHLIRSPVSYPLTTSFLLSSLLVFPQPILWWLAPQSHRDLFFLHLFRRASMFCGVIFTYPNPNRRIFYLTWRNFFLSYVRCTSFGGIIEICYR